MARKRGAASRAPKPRAQRVSRQKVLVELRLAGRRGDRAALQLALGGMRTLAHTPRYWEQYLALLRNPLARLVDLLVIKQGDRITELKGWKRPRPAPPPDGAATKSSPGRRRTAASDQPSLF